MIVQPIVRPTLAIVTLMHSEKDVTSRATEHAAAEHAQPERVANLVAIVRCAGTGMSALKLGCPTIETCAA